MNIESVRFFPFWDKTNIRSVTGFLHLVNYILSQKPVIENWLEIGCLLGESSTLLLGFQNIKHIHLIEQSKQLCDLLAKKFTKEIRENKCFIHNGLSANMIPLLNDNFFDVVYIDANHDYDFVMKDINLSYPKITNNGFLCGHDYSKSWPGVIDAVNFFISNSNYSPKDLILFEDSSWLLRKK